MTERFRNFYIDHVSRQQNVHADALASLVAFLALPAGAAEKILIYSNDLYCPNWPSKMNRFQEETFKLKKL